jgi:hypothetical protein
MSVPSVVKISFCHPSLVTIETKYKVVSKSPTTSNEPSTDVDHRRHVTDETVKKLGVSGLAFFEAIQAPKSFQTLYFDVSPCAKIYVDSRIY